MKTLFIIFTLLILFGCTKPVPQKVKVDNRLVADTLSLNVLHKLMFERKYDLVGFTTDQKVLHIYPDCIRIEGFPYHAEPEDDSIPWCKLCIQMLLDGKVWKQYYDSP